MSYARKAVTRMTLDMSRVDLQRSETVTLLDTNRRWEVTLTNGGTPFRLPNNWTASLVGVKPDENGLMLSCSVVDGRIIFDFAENEQLTTCAGAFPVVFDVWNEYGELVASPKIWLHVLPDVRPHEDLESTGQYTTIGELIAAEKANREDIDKNTEDIKANAEAIKNIAGASTSRGSFVIPADLWSDSTPTKATLHFPAETFNPGDVVLVSPADNATRDAASAAQLVINIDLSGDWTSGEDMVILVRAATGVKPTVDMTFVYAVLQTDSEDAALVTLVGVDDNDSATSLTRLTETGDGGNVSITVQNNTMYRVEGYDTVTISVPEGDYTAHLFVTFPTTAESVGFILPDGVEVSGHDPSTAAKGERWEVNLDSMGGAIFLRKAVLS